MSGDTVRLSTDGWLLPEGIGCSRERMDEFIEAANCLYMDAHELITYMTVAVANYNADVVLSRNSLPGDMKNAMIDILEGHGIVQRAMLSLALDRIRQAGAN